MNCYDRVKLLYIRLAARRSDPSEMLTFYNGGM
jgi:hypothetical protein